ncbi:hypothetical protein [Nocardia cyriacigeorgica]|nr:hypothetical protein [Nocardia cyriacigeorgica]
MRDSRPRAAAALPTSGNARPPRDATLPTGGTTLPADRAALPPRNGTLPAGDSAQAADNAAVVAGRAGPGSSVTATGSRGASGIRTVRRLLSGLLPLGLLVGLFVATAPDGEVAAAPRQRQPEACAVLSSGSACALGPLLRGLARNAPLPRTPSGSR